jgi:hypothetical protein
MTCCSVLLRIKHRSSQPAVLPFSYPPRTVSVVLILRSRDCQAQAKSREEPSIGFPFVHPSLMGWIKLIGTLASDPGYRCTINRVLCLTGRTPAVCTAMFSIYRWSVAAGWPRAGPMDVVNETKDAPVTRRYLSPSDRSVLRNTATREQAV